MSSNSASELHIEALTSRVADIPKEKVPSHVANGNWMVRISNDVDLNPCLPDPHQAKVGR